MPEDIEVDVHRPSLHPQLPPTTTSVNIPILVVALFLVFLVVVGGCLWFAAPGAFPGPARDADDLFSLIMDNEKVSIVNFVPVDVVAHKSVSFL
jgi:hypothetical protein